jgi:hypothetical protein
MMKTMEDIEESDMDADDAHLQMSANQLCSDITDNFYLTEDDLDRFNRKKTWGWQDCRLLRPPQAICLSDGAPPLPVPIGTRDRPAPGPFSHLVSHHTNLCSLHRRRNVRASEAR